MSYQRLLRILFICRTAEVTRPSVHYLDLSLSRCCNWQQADFEKLCLE